jgi:hypothetical protein
MLVVGVLEAVWPFGFNPALELVSNMKRFNSSQIVYLHSRWLCWSVVQLKSQLPFIYPVSDRLWNDDIDRMDNIRIP